MSECKFKPLVNRRSSLIVRSTTNSEYREKIFERLHSEKDYLVNKNKELI